MKFDFGQRLDGIEGTVIIGEDLSADKWMEFAVKLLFEDEGCVVEIFFHDDVLVFPVELTGGFVSHYTFKYYFEFNYSLYI